MSATKLDRSGIFQPLKMQNNKGSITLPANAVQVHKSGIEFLCADAIPSWTELSLDLVMGASGTKIRCTGVVVSCEGTRQTGYSVSLLFMNMSAQAQQQLQALSQTRAL